MALPLEQLKDRFHGALLGLAIGDALGFPFEGAPPEALGRIPAMAEDFVQRPRARFQKGQFSDDTQMTLALAEALVEKDGKFEGRVFATRFAALWTRGAGGGFGPAFTPGVGGIIAPELLCTEAAERLNAGHAWHTSGAAPEREGNGALVRATPLGLLHHDQLDRIQRDGESQAIVTHKNATARAGAIAFATAVGLNLGDAPLSPEAFCRKVALAASCLDPALGTELERAHRLAAHEPPIAYRLIARAGLPPQTQLESNAIPSRVLPSMLMGLYAFLRAGPDFNKCMDLCLRAGGDTDTTAAMAGALFGALRGAAALPARLRKGIQCADRLATTAERLYAIKAAARRVATSSAPAFAQAHVAGFPVGGRAR